MQYERKTFKTACVKVSGLAQERQGEESHHGEVTCFRVTMVPWSSDLPCGFLRCFSSAGDSARVSDGRIGEVSSVPDTLREPLTRHQRLRANGAGTDRPLAFDASRSCSLRRKALKEWGHGQVTVRGAPGSRTRRSEGVRFACDPLVGNGEASLLLLSKVPFLCCILQKGGSFASRPGLGRAAQPQF